MTVNDETLLKRVREIMPELEIEQFERNQEGLINDVLVVNNRYVFRFAKTEQFARIMDLENRILDLIRPRMDVQIPTPIYRDHDSMVYPILEGQPLTREIVLSLDESAQVRIAGQLGDFLKGLHTTAISEVNWHLPTTPAPVTRERWLENRQRVQEKVYPLLLKNQVQWADGLFETALGDDRFFEYQPALIHGDLASYHILFDPEDCEITGVLDFGVAGIGDAALDFGSLITTYGEGFVMKMKISYPDLGEYLSRARFYAQSIELQWVLLGLETGEAFWFTAHLGGARDIKG